MEGIIFYTPFFSTSVAYCKLITIFLVSTLKFRVFIVNLSPSNFKYTWPSVSVDMEPTDKQSQLLYIILYKSCASVDFDI